MAWNGRVIEIFLSGPTDVQDEKDLIKSLVQEWNQRRGRDYGCVFSLLTWEDSVTAELEEYGQGSINRQIGDDYDVNIGIMWGRFGTPTGREESGTVEEFKRALGRKRDGNEVRISYFFKMADLPLEKIDPSQLLKVREFKTLIQTEGGLTRDFSDSEQLRRQIELLLDQIAKKKDRYAGPASSKADEEESVVSLPATTPTAASKPLAAPEELGLLDLLETVEGTVEQMTDEMLQWSENTEALGASARTAGEELESLARFGQPPVTEVRIVIDRVSKVMEETATFADERSPTLTGLVRKLTTIIEARTSLADDFPVSIEQAVEEIAQYVGLADSMHSAIDGTRGLMDTIKQLPRMTARFNAARARVVTSHEPFLEELEQSLTAVGQAIEVLKRSLPHGAETDEIKSPAGTASANPPIKKAHTAKKRGGRSRRRN